MSAAKHTPGPWHWWHDGNELCPVNPDHRRSAVSQILHAEGGYGFLGRSNSDTLAELEANRRLIAAAPDLLVALANARQAMQEAELAWCNGDPSPPAELLNALSDAQDAIAKATGSDT